MQGHEGITEHNRQWKLQLVGIIRSKSEDYRVAGVELHRDVVILS